MRNLYMLEVKRLLKLADNDVEKAFEIASDRKELLDCPALLDVRFKAALYLENQVNNVRAGAIPLIR